MPSGIDQIPLFLLVFGFDQNQLDGRLQELLLGDGSLRGHHYYMRGGLSTLSTDTMWKGVQPG